MKTRPTWHKALNILGIQFLGFAAIIAFVAIWVPDDLMRERLLWSAALLLIVGIVIVIHVSETKGYYRRDDWESRP